MLLLGTCVVLMSAVQAFNSLVSLPRRAGEWRALHSGAVVRGDTLLLKVDVLEAL